MALDDEVWHCLVTFVLITLDSALLCFLSHHLSHTRIHARSYASIGNSISWKQVLQNGRHDNVCTVLYCTVHVVGQ
ncbi:hypothetical protein B0J11DRAFT_545168 [Dendryphion nanum]|uniref:Uncharacterized protein n=1 Tax=Dendryphion nanum TaxID=256645 RepID=A0A9P9CX80_9PLEO|nr:hypothetical protein B0J11DRAFT_545168 [Dendryphion nanum]